MSFFKSLTQIDDKDLLGQQRNTLGDDIVYEEWFETLLFGEDHFEDKFVRVTSKGHLFYFDDDESEEAINRKTPVIVRSSRIFFFQTFSELMKSENVFFEEEKGDQSVIKFVEVGRSKRVFFFSINDTKEVLKLFTFLEDLGAIKEEVVEKRDGPNFTRFPVQKWEHCDVLEYLRFVSSLYCIRSEKYFEEKYPSIFCEEYTGASFVEEERFSELDETDRELLFDCLLELRGEENVLLEKYSLVEKLKWFFKGSREGFFERFVKILLDPRKFCSNYLDLKRVGSLKASSHYANVLEKEKIPIKFFLSEFSCMESVLESFASGKESALLDPVLHVIPKLTEGSLRMNVLVGPFLLEWNPVVGIVLPILLDHHLTWVYKDIRVAAVLRDLSFDEIAEKLAKLLTNSNKYYSPSAPKNKALRKMLAFKSSLKFARDVFQEFEGNLDDSKYFPADFARLMEKNERKGQLGTPQLLIPNKKYAEKFQLQQNKEYKFVSHPQLEEFVTKCSEIDDLSFHMDFRGEFKLLKDIDRVFWARYFRKLQQNNEQHVENNHNFRECMFENPQKGVVYPMEFMDEEMWSY